MQQTGGILVGEANQFREKVVLAKVPRAVFHREMIAGETLTYEATIVHIKRHPVAVVASHVDQSWAPPTVEGALAWLKPVYDRWLAWKTTVDLTRKRYVEVRAEDLAATGPSSTAPCSSGAAA